jgi:PTH2 family peptidyl-tRNA hydrolase
VSAGERPVLPGDPSPDSVKQVIVIRRDLKMRRGKEIAQGSHASGAWLAEAVAAAVGTDGRAEVRLDPVARVWLTGSWRKVTLQVRSEQELVDLHERATELGLRSHLVRDSGRTEFGGVPTLTALAIGPDLAERIDQVTGELDLY